MLGAELKRRIDSAPGAVVHSGGESLIYELGFEPAKLNVGDYSSLANVGGQFPIGEVFTEPLERMCGIHLSLAAKHSVYAKPGLSRRHSRHHVDVFAVTETVTLGADTVFRDGRWCI